MRPRLFQEVRERTVRLVYEHAAEHRSEWAVIKSIAADIRCSEQTLSAWIKRRAVNRGEHSGRTTDEHARVKAQE